MYIYSIIDAINNLYINYLWNIEKIYKHKFELLITNPQLVLNIVELDQKVQFMIESIIALSCSHSYIKKISLERNF